MGFRASGFRVWVGHGGGALGDLRALPFPGLGFTACGRGFKAQVRDQHKETGGTFIVGASYIPAPQRGAAPTLLARKSGEMSRYQ